PDRRQRGIDDRQVDCGHEERHGQQRERAPAIEVRWRHHWTSSHLVGSAHVSRRDRPAGEGPWVLVTLSTASSGAYRRNSSLAGTASWSPAVSSMAVEDRLQRG